MNRLNIRINSRVYTVVADEDVEYLKSLCDYVNEKVETVLREGNHVMGEKPVVVVLRLYYIACVDDRKRLVEDIYATPLNQLFLG